MDSNDMLCNANLEIIIAGMPIVDQFVFPWLRRSGLRQVAVTQVTTGFILEGYLYFTPSSRAGE